MLFVTVAVLLGALSGQTALAKPAPTSDQSLSKAVTKLGPLSREQREMRLHHARELLGSHYKKSVVRTGENVLKVNGAIYRWTRASLPKKHLKNSDKIAQTIIDESYRHGFDPIFVLSVIQTESSFNPDRVGGVGEIGLMQIRPKTGQWIARLSGIPWKGKSTLKDPMSNIRVGVAFMAYLREKFDSHARLYIAAYNMGSGNVSELRSHEKWPKVYPAKVMGHYVDFYNEMKHEYEEKAAKLLLTSNP